MHEECFSEYPRCHSPSAMATLLGGHILAPTLEASALLTVEAADFWEILLSPNSWHDDGVLFP